MVNRESSGWVLSVREPPLVAWVAESGVVHAIVWGVQWECKYSSSGGGSSSRIQQWKREGRGKKGEREGDGPCIVV